MRDLLANGQFTERAPAAVVERERGRLRDLERQLAALDADD
jgi:valyl-tRNA synthetase